MFKNGDDVTNDSNTKVHHNVFTEVHQHVLLNSVVVLRSRINKYKKENVVGYQLYYNTDFRLPVVHKRNSISDSETSWNPCILKKLDPL